MRMNEGIPVGRPATIHLRNQHMTYAVTWYALSIYGSLTSFEILFAQPLSFFCDRYALSLATAFMFFRLVRRPARSISAAEMRGVGRS